MLYKLMYTIFNSHARVAYIFAINKESAIKVFKQSAAELGLRRGDYEVDYVFEINHIDESMMIQGADYEEGKD